MGATASWTMFLIMRLVHMMGQRRDAFYEGLGGLSMRVGLGVARYVIAQNSAHHVHTVHPFPPGPITALDFCVFHPLHA